MQPKIELLPEKKFVGKHLSMSFAVNRTAELWKSFMPERSKIENRVSNDLFSLQEYPFPFDFNPNTNFTKWALAEVTDFNVVPDTMEQYTLAGGLYAVFLHKGSSIDLTTFQYIYSEWLPQSEYLLDNRPHFEVLGAKYKNNDPESEEEIWVPIKRKN